MPVNPSEHEERRSQLRQTLRLYRVNGWIVTALPNIRYLAGFTGSNAMLLLSAERAILFTDPRYQTQAAQECDCDVRVVKGPLHIEAARWIQRLGFKSLAFEEGRISYHDFVNLKQLGIGIRLKPVAGAIEAQRAIKSPAEVATIQASVQLNS